MIRRSSRLGTRQPSESGSRATVSSSSSAGQAVDSTDRPVDDADTTTQVEVTAKPAKRKRQTKKQADTSINTNTNSQDNEDFNQDEFNAGEGSSGATKKKDRPKKNKRATSSSVTTPATFNSTESGEASIVAVPVNRSDPCTVLPTEIWHRILSYLPLFKVAQTSSVSKAWLDGSRTSPIWKSICDKGGLGKPKLKYKSHMALACANSFWICDGCYSVTKGRPRASHIPLPVSFPISLAADTRFNELDVWMLCFECRRKHYDNAPEGLYADAIGEEHIYFHRMIQMVTKTEAGKTYGLTEEDLKDLEYVVRPNPHYWRGEPMRLYERDKVQRLALVTQAGWVGIDAVRDGVARRRLTLFNQRAKEVQAGSRAQSSQ